MGFNIKIDAERCKGCELCVEACPKRLLSMSSSLNSAGAHFTRVISQNGCIGCLHCAFICPDAAIEIEQDDEVEKESIC